MPSWLCAEFAMCRVGYVPSLLCAELSHNRLANSIFWDISIIQSESEHINRHSFTRANDCENYSLDLTSDVILPTVLKTFSRGYYRCEQCISRFRVVSAESFRFGSCRPILGMGRFGLGRWVVSALCHFSPKSFRTISM